MLANIVVGHPNWKDLPVKGWFYNTRFTYLMDYMYWIIQEDIDYAKKKYSVKSLEVSNCTRENIQNYIAQYKPTAYLHGSHMGCNVVGTYPVRVEWDVEKPYPGICSQRPTPDYCCDPTVPCWWTGDVAIDCDCNPEPQIQDISVCQNQQIFSGEIVYLIGCASGRWLGPAMVASGAKAVIAYDNLLFMGLGRSPEEWWIEELYKNSYNAGWKALIDGKTAGQAVAAIKAEYQKSIDYVVREKNSNDQALYGLTQDIERIVCVGDQNATLVPSWYPGGGGGSGGVFTPTNIAIAGIGLGGAALAYLFAGKKPRRNNKQ